MEEEQQDMIGLESLIELVTKAYEDRQITQSVKVGLDGSVQGVLHVPTGTAGAREVSAAYQNVLGLVGGVMI